MPLGEIVRGASMRIIMRMAAISLLLVGLSSQASAAPPTDPCNATTAPAIDDGVLSVKANSIQLQRGWQRIGQKIEVTINSPKIPASGTVRAFVCLRWKLDATVKDASGPYVSFLPSGSTGAPVTLDKTPPLKITAVVPTNMPGTPQSPRALDRNADLPLGVYAADNAFPLADVRVVVYGEGDAPILDAMTTFGVIGADTYCNVPLAGTAVDSGIGQLGANKNWQPIAGEFAFTVKTEPKSVPSTALVKVCYRWKLRDLPEAHGDPGPFTETPRSHMIDRQQQSIKVAAAVPNIPNMPARYVSQAQTTNGRVGSFAIPLLNMVELADARILIFDTDGSPVADVMTTVGITSVWYAAIMVLLAVLLAFFILWRIATRRLVHIKHGNPLLSIITTRNGYASLSQFQIMLWTFVVIASAAYVMALSGDLIEISSGTLVLLGISGSATVIAKAKSENDAKTPPPQPDPAKAAADADTARKEADKAKSDAAIASGDIKEDADAKATEYEAIAKAAQATAVAVDAVAKAQQLRKAIADAANKETATKTATDAEDVAQQKLKDAELLKQAAKEATRQRHPAWSDLVMEEVKGRELDVTRIQMLYFTLVTAVFVGLKVITSYEIPLIPEGFLLLMGISNSVYVGSKFATNSNAS